MSKEQFNNGENNKNADAIKSGFKKAIIGAAVILANLGDGEAQVVNKGSLPSGKEPNNIENETVGKNIGNGKVYFASAEEFVKRKEGMDNAVFTSEVTIDDSIDKIKFQATNYFETDSCVLTQEAKEKITSDFKKLLNKINPDNYEEALKLGITVNGGADPRTTSNPDYFDPSKNIPTNTLLVEKRLESFVELLKDILKGFKLSNLNEEKQEILKRNLKISGETTTSTIVENAEEGVIYPEDLGYSKDDLAKMSKEELEEIYSKCRMVTVSFGVENKKKNIEITPNKIEFAEQNYIFIDGSPSVGFGNSYSMFIDQIISNNEKVEGKDLFLVYFDSKLGRILKMENPADLIKDIKEHKFSGDVKELAVDALLTAAQSIPQNSEKSTFKLFTDEELQGVTLGNIKNLQKLCKDKNILANYYIRIGNKIREVSLEEIRTLFEEQLFDNFKNVMEKYIKDKTSEIQKQKMIIPQKDQHSLVEQQKNLNNLILSMGEGSLDGVLDNPLFKADSRKFTENELGVISVKELLNVGKEVVFSNTGRMPFTAEK